MLIYINIRIYINGRKSLCQYVNVNLIIHLYGVKYAEI